MLDRSFWLFAAHRRILASARATVRGKRGERRQPRTSNIEVLESRMLLSAATGVDQSTPLFTKLGSVLGTVAMEYDALHASTPEAKYTTNNPLVRIVDDKVVVDTVATNNVDKLETDLESLGATITGSYGQMVSALVPLDSLDALAGLASMRLAHAAAAFTDAGVTTSQGVQAMGTNLLPGLDGSGTTVGILSDSFDTYVDPSSPTTIRYADDVATADLPPNVNVLFDSPGGTDEGRAMAQIVHDVAPGANLAFATANGGQAAFASNILALQNAGADVIVDDVRYFEEPFFQDGVIAQAVDTVVADGVAYLDSAGNYASNSYESVYRPGTSYLPGDIQTSPTTPNAPAFRGGVSHDFNPLQGVVDDRQGFTLDPANPSITITFQWDSPFFSVSGGSGSPNDLDIYVLDSNNQIVAGSSTSNQGLDASEFFFFAGPPGTYSILITTFGSGPAPGLIKYVNRSSIGGIDTLQNLEYRTDSATSYGHSTAQGAMAVGAAAYQDTPPFGANPPVLEPYSSLGGVPILFSTSGTRLAAPDVRNAPAFVAPDGADTTFFAPLSDIDLNGFPNFNGTSASAPHAAGIVALLRQLDRSLSPNAIRQILQQSAIDMGSRGYDFQSGSGLIDYPAAVAAVPDTTSATTSVPLPTSFTAHSPEGSLVYEANQPIFQNSLADVDSYTVTLNAGQTLSVLVHPVSTTLQPRVSVYFPGPTTGSPGTLLATAQASQPGQDATLQPVLISTPGVYTIQVGSAAGSTGIQIMRVLLNAAIETEGHGSGPNNTVPTAQVLTPSLIALGGGATRGAMLGTGEIGTTSVSVFSANFDAGNNDGFVVDNSGGGMWHLSTGHGSDTGHTAPGSLYYGLGETTLGGGSYSNGSAPTAGTLTSPSFLVPSNGRVTVSFNYILDTIGIWTRDEANLQIGVNGTFTTLARYNVIAESLTWRAAVPVDISEYAGQSVSLRWSFDTVTPRAVAGEGWYIDDVQVTNTLLTPDYYSIALNQGDSATFAVTNLAGGYAEVQIQQLQNGTPVTLATSISGATNLSQVVNDFLAPATGTYFVRVLAAAGAEYTLVATRNAAFDSEPNNTFSGAQGIARESVLGAIDAASAEDWYRLPLTAGNSISFTAISLFTGVGDFSNTLVPELELYDSGNNLLVSSSAGSAVFLNYVAGADDTYRVRVRGTNNSTGEYALVLNYAAWSGIVTGQSVADTGTINPFTTVALLDTLSPPSVTINVRADSIAKGAFTAASLAANNFTVSPSGGYNFAGTIAQAVAALHGLVYQPVANRKPVGTAETINISLRSSDGQLSPTTAQFTLLSQSINDAPVLAAGSPILPGITNNQKNSPGATVGSILGTSVSDRDLNALKGMAITGTVNGSGVWQYSTDAGATWVDVGSVSVTSALLLRSQDLIRFVPGSTADAISITYIAWDQTAGTFGTKVDVSVSGGSTPFSAGGGGGGSGGASNATATLDVALNHAPVLGAGSITLPPTTDVSTNELGVLVVDALVQAGELADVDPGSLQGIAVVAADNAKGNWQWSVDDGVTWANFGTVSDSSAVLLAADAASRIRFVSAPLLTGEIVTAAIGFRGWDQTTGVAGSAGNNVAANGGSEAFSTGIATGIVTATHVNKAPVMTPLATAPAPQNVFPPIVEDNLANAGLLVSDLIGDTVQITDGDTGAVQGIAVVALDTLSGGWQFSLDGGGTWIDFGFISDNSATLLASDALTKIRFQPNFAFNGTVSSGLTFRAWDQTIGANGLVFVDTATTGGDTAFSTASQTVGITVSPVADTPNVQPTTTSQNTQTQTGLVITRSALDGTEVGFFRISFITGGELFQNDGVTPIVNGQFITAAQGNAGLRFTPALDSIADGGFRVQASLTNSNAGVGGSFVQVTVPVSPGTPLLVLYRAHNPVNDDYFFTTSLPEFHAAVRAGYTDESTGRGGFALAPTPAIGTVPLHRVYNPNNGEHYYTSSDGERDHLVSVGWRNEGNEGFIFPTQTAGTDAIFRLYNRLSGFHLLTNSTSVVQAILRQFPGIWFQHETMGYGFNVDSVSTTSSVVSAASVSAAEVLSLQASDATSAGGNSGSDSTASPLAPAIAPQISTRVAAPTDVVAGSAQDATPASGNDASPSQADVDEFWSTAGLGLLSGEALDLLAV